MPHEQIRQFIRDSVQAELANGTSERDWSSLQFKFPPQSQARYLSLCTMALSDSRLAASRRAANRSALTAVAWFLQMTRSLSILFYPLSA